MRQDIAAFRDAGATCWIVDLRGNSGGNMWPMLGGIGPLAGSGTLGFFVSERFSVPWFYQAGEVGVRLATGKTKVNFKILDDLDASGAFQDPVAVLIDKYTASSGEAVAISFRGRDKTAFFGQRTRGLSTCNDVIRLPDGARLLLTVAVDADRHGRKYDAGVVPDCLVERADSDEDVEVKRALEWLAEPI